MYKLINYNKVYNNKVVKKTAYSSDLYACIYLIIGILEAFIYTVCIITCIPYMAYKFLSFSNHIVFQQKIKSKLYYMKI